MFQDVLGRKIELGDVVVKSYYGGYASIKLGIVVGFTQKTVKIKKLNHKTGELADKPICTDTNLIIVINETFEMYKKSLKQT